MTGDIAALTGLVALLGYYITVWIMVGVDPGKGAIAPRYKPPEGISPAAARYLLQMKYDTKCLAAAIANLGVHRWLTFTATQWVYFVQKGPSKDARDLTTHETRLAKDLLASNRKLRVKPVNRRVMSEVLTRHEKALNREYERTHFLTNRRHWFPGILIVALTVLGIAGTSDRAVEILFLMLWMGVWGIVLVILGLQAIAAWKRVLHGKSFLPALLITAFVVPFYAAEGLAAWDFAQVTSTLTMSLLVTMLFVLLLFFHLLKAPTLLGRKVMDKLEGFRMYLSGAKDNRLAYMSAPTLTRELFERYLPYAIALDVEAEWAASAAETPATQHTGEASWFQSRVDSNPPPATVARMLGNDLASAIAASSTTRRRKATSHRTRHHPAHHPGRTTHPPVDTHP